MRRPLASRSLGVFALLLAGALGVCGWQWAEHRRFERAAAQALVNRGRDITSTLGVVVRSQRRFGLLVSKERIESALQDLIHPGQLESITILGATGETIATAGRPPPLTADLLRAPGVQWRADSVTLMNLMDLGPAAADDPARPAAAIIVSDPRAFRPGQARRAAAADTAATKAGDTTDAAAPAARTPFGRPSWMSREDYDAVIQKQGMHSLVISLSTAEMRRAVRNDLLLRSLVGLLALGAAGLSALAWRNVVRNSELQIRLVRAGEMNARLSEMAFAAAGLAHETRNPLNLIRGLAHLIGAEPAAAPKLKEHAAGILEEADRVTVQLNEFIHYSKPREAHPVPVEVARLIADVARTLQPDLEEKRIVFSPPPAPLTIAADPPLLRQALFNLILNAVQAVGPGGRIEARWSATGAGEAALEIRDDGPGVPAAERTNIFKPYVTMRPTGAGLGLAIVRQIASAHHWEIACEAHAPRGAVFRLSHLRIAA
jgi:signal transduction histidine kinase